MSTDPLSSSTRSSDSLRPSSGRRSDPLSSSTPHDAWSGAAGGVGPFTGTLEGSVGFCSPGGWLAAVGTALADGGGRATTGALEGTADAGLSCPRTAGPTDRGDGLGHGTPEREPGASSRVRSRSLASAWTPGALAGCGAGVALWSFSWVTAQA